MEKPPSWIALIVASLVTGIVAVVTYGWGVAAVKCPADGCHSYSMDWSSAVTSNVIDAVTIGVTYFGVYVLLGLLVYIGAGLWYLRARPYDIPVSLYFVVALVAGIAGIAFGVHDGVVHHGVLTAS